MDHESVKVVERLKEGSWATSNSLWTYHLNLSCCGLEFQSALGPRYDWERFGAIVVDDPAIADLLIVDGPVNSASANLVRDVYLKMESPKYVISMGSCANSGGMFVGAKTDVIRGVDTIVPVDIFVPGCPPRPEAMMNALIRLQEKILGKNAEH